MTPQRNSPFVSLARGLVPRFRAADHAHFARAAPLAHWRRWFPAGVPGRTPTIPGKRDVRMTCQQETEYRVVYQLGPVTVELSTDQPAVSDYLGEFYPAAAAMDARPDWIVDARIGAGGLPPLPAPPRHQPSTRGPRPAPRCHIGLATGSPHLDPTRRLAMDSPHPQPAGLKNLASTRPTSESPRVRVLGTQIWSWGSSFATSRGIDSSGAATVRSLL